MSDHTQTVPHAMTLHADDRLLNLLPSAVNRLSRARERGAPTPTVETVAKHVNEVGETRDALDRELARVNRDTMLSGAGKRTRVDALRAGMIDNARRSIESARGTVDTTRRHLTERSTYPRTDTPDRHARMLAARHDLDRLLANARPGDVPKRMAHAIETSPDVAELVLADGYDTRVALPALGDGYDADLALWETQRARMLQERLDDGGRRAMQQLEALKDLDAAVLIGDSAVKYYDTALAEIADRYAPAPAAATDDG